MSRFEHMPDAPEGLPIQPPKQPEVQPAPVTQPIVQNETLKHPPQWTATEHYDPASKSRYKKEYDEEAGAIHLVDPLVDKEAPNYRVASLYPEIRGGAADPADIPNEAEQKRQQDARQSGEGRSLTQEEIDDLFAQQQRSSQPTPLVPIEPIPPTQPIVNPETSNRESDPRAAVAEERAKRAEESATRLNETLRTLEQTITTRMRKMQAEAERIQTQLQQQVNELEGRTGDLVTRLNQETQARQNTEQQLTDEVQARRSLEDRQRALEEDNQRLREELSNQRPPEPEPPIIDPEAEQSEARLASINEQINQILHNIESSGKDPYTDPDIRKLSFDISQLQVQSSRIVRQVSEPNTIKTLERLLIEKQGEITDRREFHAAYVALHSGNIEKWKQHFDKLGPKGLARIYNIIGVKEMIAQIEKSEGNLFTIDPTQAEQERNNLIADLSLDISPVRKESAMLLGERMFIITGESEVYNSPKVEEEGIMEFVDTPLSLFDEWKRIFSEGRIDYGEITQGNSERVFREIFYNPAYLEGQYIGKIARLRKHGYTYAQDMVSYLSLGTLDTLSEVMDVVETLDAKSLSDWSADIQRAWEFKSKFRQYIDKPLNNPRRVAELYERRLYEDAVDYKTYKEAVKNCVQPIVELVKLLPEQVRETVGIEIMEATLVWLGTDHAKDLMQMGVLKWDEVTKNLALLIVGVTAGVISEAQEQEIDRQAEKLLTKKGFWRSGGDFVSQKGVNAVANFGDKLLAVISKMAGI